MIGPEYIDCQDCGEHIKELSMSEAQQVAANPCSYIWYCTVCKRERGWT